jgi:hypothetical protein
VVIRLPFEGSPQVLCDFMDDGAESRMVDWLQSRPDLLELIQTALVLAGAA